MSRRTGMSRRSLFQLAGAGGLSLLLPKTARGEGPSGPVKRVIFVTCGGGIRWTCTWDGQADLAINPWGNASWGALGSSKPAPEWGFGRMLMQKPVVQGTTDWSGTVLPYLRSDSNYNTQRSALTTWSGKTVPTIADVAHETAIVRVNNNPSGDVNLDHNAAGAALYTGSTAWGSAGIVTAIYDGLKRQMGANLDGYYNLPPVVIGDASSFGAGVGAYAGSRPLQMWSATSLPYRDTTAKVSKWGRRAETRLDAAFAAGRPTFAGDKVADLANDKVGADRHGSKLLNPVLKVGQYPDESLGNVHGTLTAMTNRMLGELFAIKSDVTPAGDILFDAYRSNGITTWDRDEAGYNAAFSVRLLQMGAPMVAFSIYNLFDSHAGEVTGDNRGSHAMGIIQVSRMLGALELALKSTTDPMNTSATLWDSTVVFVCSEFGRPGGFNVGDGGTNGGGSDHGPWSAWPIMGGPVVQSGAGGKIVKSTANGGFYHQNQFYTTLMAGMGIASEHSTYLQYFDYPPIGGLFQGV